MHLFLPLSLCLLFMASNANAEQVVVEKIVSDETAIETIIFESAPLILNVSQRPLLTQPLPRAQTLRM